MPNTFIQLIESLKLIYTRDIAAECHKKTKKTKSLITVVIKWSLQIYELDDGNNRRVFMIQHVISRMPLVVFIPFQSWFILMEMGLLLMFTS